MEQSLGKRIMSNRKRLGLTQDQLAEKLGVTAQAVSKWENDLSCPDISMLPQLAEIFGITTDVLLGRQHEEVYEAELVSPEEDNTEKSEQRKGNFEFTWNPGRKGSISFALIVVGVGVLYLLAELLKWDIGFWDILWPTALLVYGLVGLFPRFSLFRCGCAVLGGYFLVSKLFPLSVSIDGGVIFAAAIVLFGISLLTDVLRKPKKGGFHMTYTDKDGKVHSSKTRNHYETGEDSFCYDGSFGETRQTVCVSRLRSGTVNSSFGEYVLDLSEVEEVYDDCRIEANCSFGELTLLVPERFVVIPDSATSFASFNIKGQPREMPEGRINIDANVSFGEITVHYI